LEYEIIQGKEPITIDLPGNWDITNIPMPDKKPLKDLDARLTEVLNKPTDSPPLLDLCKPEDQIAICVTDVSRPSPDYLILPIILKELEKAGISKNNVTILIGTGSHRDVTFDEIRTKYGYYASKNYRIINHNSRDKNGLTDLGNASTGAPRVVNSILTKVDHIFNIGVTDLHQYAGYSGGAKTIAVGCAGEETIQYTHSAGFLDKSGAIPGRIRGNLFQKTLWEIVRPLPFDFSVNLILNEKGEVLDLEAGNPLTIFLEMVKRSKPIFEYETDKQYDIAFLGVPFPKDMNLYQATRAATYQALSDSPALKKGAIINLYCSCPEGTGMGVGEQRFKEKMTKLSNPAAILLSMTGKKTFPGEQRAFMVAKAMMDYKINIVGTKIDVDELENMGFLVEDPVSPELALRDLQAVVLKDGMKKVMKFRAK